MSLRAAGSSVATAAGALIATRGRCGRGPGGRARRHVAQRDLGPRRRRRPSARRRGGGGILHRLVVLGTARGVAQQDYRSVDRALLGGGALSEATPRAPRSADQVDHHVIAEMVTALASLAEVATVSAASSPARQSGGSCPCARPCAAPASEPPSTLARPAPSSRPLEVAHTGARDPRRRVMSVPSGPIEERDGCRVTTRRARTACVAGRRRAGRVQHGSVSATGEVVGTRWVPTIRSSLVRHVEKARAQPLVATGREGLGEREHP